MSANFRSTNTAHHRAMVIALIIGLSLLLTLLCARALGAFTHTGAVVSDFSHGTDGWSVRGPAMGPAWEPNEGRPPGSLMAAGADPGATWYWRAPAKFLGDHADAYGRTLRYDAKLPYPTADGLRGAQNDVVLRGAEMTLVYDDRTPAMSGWTTHVIPLAETAGWSKLDGLTRTPLGHGDLRKALGSLSSLEIRGGSGEMMAPTYLDNVVLNASYWAFGGYPGLLALCVIGAIAGGTGWRTLRRR